MSSGAGPPAGASSFLGDRIYPARMLARLTVAVIAILAGCSQAAPQVIHIANWHYVSPEDYAADLRNQDPDLTDAGIERSYAEFHNTMS